MGQKINPKSFRLGVTKNWPVRWFFSAKGGHSAYASYLAEDEVVRNLIKKKLKLAGISAVEIERTLNNVRIFIKTARPGFIIGRGGKGIEEFTKELEAEIKKLRGVKNQIAISVNVEELKRSEIAAPYIAQQIAWDLEKRLPFRRTMKKYVEQIMQNREAKGSKITMSGRLGGNEIARTETLKAGSLPLQNLRADIDYGEATAFTTYGTIGVKVWIYKGEIFAGKTGSV